jgi:hypothetical protein
MELGLLRHLIVKQKRRKALEENKLVWGKIIEFLEQQTEDKKVCGNVCLQL